MSKKMSSTQDEAIHDLRTPLTNIKTYSHLLSRNLKAGDPRAQKYLAKIEANASKLELLLKKFAHALRSAR